jgi:glycosyltransferase involved in cell wall biosynthesis
MPKASVVIPSYNHSAYIHAAVSSVLSQSETDLELIVVDDGSTDDSLDVLSRFSDPRLHVLSQTNQGAHAAINRGLQAAQGDYLAILNSDDVYHPQRLQKAISVLENDTRIGLVGSHIEIIDANGKRLGIKRGYKDCEPWNLASPERSFRAGTDLRAALLTENYWATTSNYVFTRRWYEQVGEFRPLRYAHDWDFALRMVRVARLALLPEPLMRYRVHSSNTIREDQAAMIFEICWILATHLPEHISDAQFFDQQPLETRIDQLLNSVYVYDMERVLSVMLLQGLHNNLEAALQLLDEDNPVRARYMQFILDAFALRDDGQAGASSFYRSVIERGLGKMRDRFSTIIESPSPEGGENPPAISLIMPSYNHAYDLERTLAAYDRQVGGDAFELIVVDDGSTDHTYEILNSYRPQRYALQGVRLTNNQGPAAARNAGIALAKAPLVLFVGDDISPDPFLITGHLVAHRRHPATEVAILGRIQWPADMPVNTLMRHIDGPGAQQFSYHYLQNEQEYDFRHFYTANISLKRGLLQSAGQGFDTDFRYAAFEDVELSYRMKKRGMRIIYLSDLLAYHYHYHTIWSFSTRQYQAGLMACTLTKKHPEIKGVIFGKYWWARNLKLRVQTRLRKYRSAEQLETKALQVLSSLEWEPRPELDFSYLRTLRYFFFKGLVHGSLGLTKYAEDIMSVYANKLLLPAISRVASI